jgi:hypothetical protein
VTLRDAIMEARCSMGLTIIQLRDRAGQVQPELAQRLRAEADHLESALLTIRRYDDRICGLEGGQ